jgi:exodeoxyribonuclease V alpha subunit
VQLLDIAEASVEQALSQMVTKGDFVFERIGTEELVFLPYLARAEREIAQRVLHLSRAGPAFPPVDFEKAVVWCEERTGKHLAPSQREALRQALNNRLSVITGGPGVGKTTLVRSLITILQAKKVRCLLCAPTGRAAKRLSESTGAEAKPFIACWKCKPAPGASPETKVIRSTAIC